MNFSTKCSCSHLNQKTKQNYSLNYALASKMSQIKKIKALLKKFQPCPTKFFSLYIFCSRQHLATPTHLLADVILEWSLSILWMISLSTMTYVTCPTSSLTTIYELIFNPKALEVLPSFASCVEFPLWIYILPTNSEL